MPIIIGAIAYRAGPNEKADERINSRPMTREDDGARSEHARCPKCGESYALVEGIDVTEEIWRDDLEFLAKALSTGHPSHPAAMIIRDPNGVLNRYLSFVPPSALERTEDAPIATG